MTLESYLDLIMETFKDWQEDRDARLADALAYYTTFSISPLLVLVISFAGLLGGWDAAQGMVMTQVQDLVGLQGREFVQDMILNAPEISTGTIASINRCIPKEPVLNHLQTYMQYLCLKNRKISHCLSLAENTLIQ